MLSIQLIATTFATSSILSIAFMNSTKDVIIFGLSNQIIRIWDLPKKTTVYDFCFDSLYPNISIVNKFR